MTDAVIKVEGLGKQYTIGASYRRRTLSEVIAATLAPWRRESGHEKPHDEGTIWALEDVSFEVLRGQVLGIIGSNGSGKSTLLKILSRITDPTKGHAELHGQVGSLLEVGTGFHPELTGRENVYLSGAILGLKRAEITRRFDEIVAFSEIERLIDTPVKRYSSGMYVRLAFAVASHLLPDILILDEVLAVGDIAFQRKCHQKIHGVARSGRTVLFVSHSMDAVKSLCDRGLVLARGRTAFEGTAEEAARKYAPEDSRPVFRNGVIPSDTIREDGTGEALLRRVRLLDAEGRRLHQLFFAHGPVVIRLLYEVRAAIDDAAFEVGISTPEGLRTATVTNVDRGGKPCRLDPGWWEVVVDLDVDFMPGEYVLDVCAHHMVESTRTVDWVDRAYAFTVLAFSERGDDHYQSFAGDAKRGFLRPRSTWRAPIEASPPDQPES